MATRINLLPWRELRRREQDRQLLSVSIGAWILMGVVVFYAQWHMDSLISHQNNRNQFLQSEIGKLEKKIKEIEELKQRKEALLARMEIIQQLQRNRTQIVHVFDDLVRKLPKGIYLTSLQKKKENITLSGLAQSNARVSALMRNLESSDWFTGANLDVIQITPREGTRASKFTLKVRQTGKKEDSKETKTNKTTGQS